MSGQSPEFSGTIGGEVKAVVVLFFGLGVLILGIWIGASALEARAYNRVTGKHVTTWDAMFVELRVQEGAKE